VQDEGRAPLVEGAMSKVTTTELLARIARVGAMVLGADVLTAPGWFGDPLPAWFAYEQVERLHPLLSVGANEVQRTTIGQAGLGPAAGRAGPAPRSRAPGCRHPPPDALLGDGRGHRDPPAGRDRGRDRLRCGDRHSGHVLRGARRRALRRGSPGPARRERHRR